MTYAERTQDIYNQMMQGKLLDAFDQYYGENVVMTDSNGTREGKVAAREYEVQFVNMIKEVHGMEVLNIVSDEQTGVVFHQSTMDVTFQDGNRVQMEQVGVQQWEGDFIVNEKFYN